MRRLLRQSTLLYSLCIILLTIAIVLVYRIMAISRTQDVVGEPVVYTTVPMPIDPASLSGRLAVATTDGGVSLFDSDTGTLVPLPIPVNLFDRLYHFSVSPQKDAAYLVGSTQTNGVYPQRYAYINIENDSLVWFDAAAFNHLAGGPYRVHDMVIDRAGRGFLFSLVNDPLPETTPRKYTVVYVDPARAHGEIITSVRADDFSLQYFSSQHKEFAYTVVLSGAHTSIQATFDGKTAALPSMDSVLYTATDVLFSSYTKNGGVTIASVRDVDDIKLTIVPDDVYTIIHPHIAVSNDGSYVAYRARQETDAEDIVRVSDAAGDILAEQIVAGPVDLFFSPDETRLLIVSDAISYIIDIQRGAVEQLHMPQTVDAVLGWYLI